jgi:hypothetical protein
MNSSLNHGSAKIYQFPAGGRSALGGRRYEETETAGNDLATSRPNETACSSGWYHEAAIQESNEPGRER